MWNWRFVIMLPVLLKEPVVGSYSSALDTEVVASLASHQSEFCTQTFVDEEFGHSETERGLRRDEMVFMPDGGTIRCLGLPRCGFASAKSAASSTCS